MMMLRNLFKLKAFANYNVNKCSISQTLKVGHCPWPRVDNKNYFFCYGNRLLFVCCCSRVGTTHSCFFLAHDKDDEFYFFLFSIEYIAGVMQLFSYGIARATHTPFDSSI